MQKQLNGSRNPRLLSVQTIIKHRLLVFARDAIEMQSWLRLERSRAQLPFLQLRRTRHESHERRRHSSHPRDEERVTAVQTEKKNENSDPLDNLNYRMVTKDSLTQLEINFAPLVKWGGGIAE